MGFPASSADKESACNVRDTSSISRLESSPGEGIDYPLQYSWASLLTQMAKNLPAMRETWVQSPGWKIPGGGYGNPHQYSCLASPLRQGSLVCCSPWGSKELDTTEHSTTGYSMTSTLFARLLSTDTALFYISNRSMYEFLHSSTGF